MQRELIAMKKDIYEMVHGIDSESFVKIHSLTSEDGVAERNLMDTFVYEIASQETNFFYMSDLMKLTFDIEFYIHFVADGILENHEKLLELTEEQLIEYYICTANEVLLSVLVSLDIHNVINFKDVNFYIMDKEHGCSHKIDSEKYMVELNKTLEEGYIGEYLSDIGKYAEFVNKFSNYCNCTTCRENDCTHNLILGELIELEFLV